MKAPLHNQPKSGVSKGKMLLGAAGLLMFIVGIRKTLQTDQGTLDGNAPTDRTVDPDQEPRPMRKGTR
ncbi:MAG: hypothetical protein JO040_09760 [Gemmatimonadetes bacterium]|nr:hypothetical protein [Gemmatimonadota bacterium]